MSFLLKGLRETSIKNSKAKLSLQHEGFLRKGMVYKKQYYVSTLRVNIFGLPAVFSM